MMKQLDYPGQSGAESGVARIRLGQEILFELQLKVNPRQWNRYPFFIKLHLNITNTMEVTKKRTRANTAGNDTSATPSEASVAPSQSHLPSAEDVAKYLQPIKPDMHLKLLTDAANNHPDVLTAIKAEHKQAAEIEAAKVISFNHYVRHTDYELNERFSRLGSREQYYKTGDVVKSIGRMLKEIAGSVTVSSSFMTKFNALEAIRGIFEIVLGSRG